MLIKTWSVAKKVEIGPCFFWNPSWQAADTLGYIPAKQGHQAQPVPTRSIRRIQLLPPATHFTLSRMDFVQVNPRQRVLVDGTQNSSRATVVNACSIYLSIQALVSVNSSQSLLLGRQASLKERSIQQPSRWPLGTRPRGCDDRHRASLPRA